MLGFSEEERNRPQFRPTTRHRNPITGKMEKYYPPGIRQAKQVGSFATMLFMLALVIIIVFSVIVYRVAVRAALAGHFQDPQQGTPILYYFN